jgi:hypothetical protein
MRFVTSLIVLLLCIFTLQPAGRAADLTKTERRIRKEPDYKSPTPAYCLLVFGPAAADKLWLVYDDAADLLYIDRNGNGDLTELEEVVKASSQKFRTFEDLEVKTVRFDAGRLSEPKGKTEHTEVMVELEVFRGKRKEFFLPAARVSMDVNGTLRQEAGFGKFSFALRPDQAPILHFNGPLTMFVALEPHRQIDSSRGELALALPEVQDLVGDPVDFRVNIGTPGLGDDAWVKVTIKGPPADSRIVAEIEFPNLKDPKQPIRQTYELRERCCVAVFHGPVRIPEGVNRNGNAKITLRFLDWKERNVAPVTVEVPVSPINPSDSR